MVKQSLLDDKFRCPHCSQWVEKLTTNNICPDCDKRWSQAYCPLHSTKLDLDYLCPVCESEAEIGEGLYFYDDDTDDDDTEELGDWNDYDDSDPYMRYVPDYADVYANDLRGLKAHVKRIVIVYTRAAKQRLQRRVHAWRYRFDHKYRDRIDEIPF